MGAYLVRCRVLSIGAEDGGALVVLAVGAGRARARAEELQLRARGVAPRGRHAADQPPGALRRRLLHRRLRRALDLEGIAEEPATHGQRNTLPLDTRTAHFLAPTLANAAHARASTYD